MYQVTKTYGHSLGLSACFRQHKARSHCRFLHGYALSFKLVFQSPTLNDQNWVIDFGGLKPIKEFLFDTFDHKLIIAQDDPQIDRLLALGTRGVDRDALGDVRVLPAVGCEAFAYHVFNYVRRWLHSEGHSERVVLMSVECAEHDGNSAIFKG